MGEGIGWTILFLLMLIPAIIVIVKVGNIIV